MLFDNSVNYLLLSSDGSKIGYAKACVVELVYILIGVVLPLVIAGILAMIFGTALFAMH